MTDTDDIKVEIPQNKSSGFGGFFCCSSSATQNVHVPSPIDPPPTKYTSTPPDEDFHANKLVKLSRGYTAYRILDPIASENSNPPLIVLLHGLYDSSYIWADVAELLADFEQGPRAQVLIMDFYGHGRSPWNGQDITLDYLVTQVKELLDNIGVVDRCASFIGFDLGGAVAVGVAAKYPELCKSITLLGSVGIKYKTLIGEELLALPIAKSLVPEKQEQQFQHSSDDCPHKNLIEKQINMCKWQIQNTPGYIGAIQSIMKHFPIKDMQELYAAVGRNPRKMLAIWGTNDKLCPGKKCLDFLEEVFPDGLIVDVLDCGHNMIYEKFEEVATEILKFHREVFEEDE